MLAIVLSVLLQAVSPQPQKPAPDAQEAFVIEHSFTRHRFENDGTGRREARARVKVQTDAGVQTWGQLVFGYSAGTERLEIEYVRVRKADGSVVTTPLDTAVQDLSSPVQQVAPVYTDFRQKHVTVPGLRPGETLEYSIVTTIHTPLAAGHFWTEYDFQRHAITLDEQLELDVPAARSLTLKTAPDAAPQVAEAGGRKTYRWTSAHKVRAPEKDAEALAAEAALNPRRPAVRVTTFQSWEEVGRWYQGLEKGPRAVTPDIRKKAEELTAGRRTEMEKLEALYDFVAPGFRYVSISLGMGRYQPRAAADVLRDQYGDCKDKHTLLAALMEAVGLRASTVLINSTTKVDPSFPSPSQFDHAITFASADGQDVWMDVTTEIAPFRMLSANLRKKQALVVPAGDAARLLDTPVAPPMQTMVVQEFDGELGPLGRLSGRVKLSVRGDMELLLRDIFYRLPETQWKEVLDGANQSLGLMGDISDWKVSDPKATHEPFAIEYKVSRTGFVDWTKKTASVALPLSKLDMVEPADKSADPDIEFGSPGYIEFRINLRLGEGYKGRPPLPVSVKRDYATYGSTYSMEGQQIIVRRRLDMLSGTIPRDRAGDVRSFRRAVLADTAQMLTLDIAATASDAAAPDLKASELVRTGYDALQSHRYAQAITLLKRALELEPKNSMAWTYLGSAHMQLRDYDGALKAYQELLKLNPYDETVHNQIGWLHQDRRRYAEAEAAYRKQLELNPLDKFAHRALGGLLVDMERYDEAVAQLQKAITMEPDVAELQVRLGTAYLHLGKSVEALAGFTKAVELTGNPNTWNNVAYQLAVKGVHLDRALQYAESAVSAVAAASRNFTVDHFSTRELGIVRSLASYWDTLGWVHFAKGDLARAEALVSAAWALEPTGEVGDHLAQIHEKQGRRDDAIRMYALAMSADRPVADTRRRLATLAGGDTDTFLVTLDPMSALLAHRSFAVQGPKGATGMADFIVLLGEDGRSQAVKFVSGEEKLRPMDVAIRGISFGPALPDAAPAKVLRRGTASCTAKGCSFVLFPASHAQAVQ